MIPQWLSIEECLRRGLAIADNHGDAFGDPNGETQLGFVDLPPTLAEQMAHDKRIIKRYRLKQRFTERIMYTTFVFKAEGIYLIVGRQGPNLYNNVWVKSERGVSKPHACAQCRKTIKKGERAYRPLTNGYNRMDRMHVLCVESQKGRLP